MELILPIGLIRVAVKLCDGIRPRFRDLFPGPSMVLSYIWGSLILSLASSTGLLLFVIPGVVVLLQGGFFPYFVVDKKAGGWRAIELSRKMTKGSLANLLLFYLLLAGVNILGALCLVVGLFVTVPVTMIAQAFMYRQMEIQKGWDQRAPGVRDRRQLA